MPTVAKAVVGVGFAVVETGSEGEKQALDADSMAGAVALAGGRGLLKFCRGRGLIRNLWTKIV